MNYIQNRKVIQIVTDNDHLYALCNDGTLWKRILVSAIAGHKWLPINIAEIEKAEA